MRRDAARSLVTELFGAGLAAVAGRARTAAALRAEPALAAGTVIAAGKAAPAMYAGACDALGGAPRRGLVVTKHGHAEAIPALAGSGVKLIEAGHPVPDTYSLRAGEALLDLVDELPASEPVLLLISGGASSLVEAPVRGVGLEELERANDWLLASGWDIARVNAVRARLSRLKGGGLARRLGDRPASALFISDVAGDDPAVIGGGWMAARAGAAEDLNGLPGWLKALAARHEPAAPARPSSVQLRIVARLADAIEAVAAEGRRRGLEVEVASTRLAGEAADTGQRLAAELAAGRPRLTVCGGEPVVTLPEEPGRGGRCQQLALAAAQRLAGRQGHCLLACGTDGSDGPTATAGALVDAGTVERGRAAGLDAAAALSGADAGRLLAATGDLVVTGPTGTNVNDLVLGLKW